MPKKERTLEEKLKDSKNLISFGHYINNLRSQKRLILAEVAKELDISTNYLSELERGKKSPSDRMVVSIAEYYKIPVLDLFLLLDRGPGIISYTFTSRPLSLERLNRALHSYGDLKLPLEITTKHGEMLGSAIVEFVEAFVNARIREIHQEEQ
jgi:transcriptional regulator with XRE-family HTH domain